MRHQVPFLMMSLVICGFVTNSAHALKHETTPATITRGKDIYERNCIYCHGAQGKGDGPAAFFGASFSAPRPNDFTVGQYKFRSTASGKPPTDEDLFRTITNGVPGYMPSFVGLSQEDRWYVLSYLKTFNPIYDGEAPDTLHIGFPTVSPTPRSIEQGRQIYFKFECDACHGPNARGESPDFEAQELKDSFDMPIRSTDLDLTNSFSFKNGASASDVFRTLMTGLDGTPMPSYANAFAEQEEDAWHLVNYLLSLSQSPKP